MTTRGQNSETRDFQAGYQEVGGIPEPFAGDGKLGGRLYTELRSARFIETTPAVAGTGWILRPNGTSQFDTVIATAFTVESEYMRTVFGTGITFQPYAYDSGDPTALWNPGGDQLYPTIFTRKEAGVDYIYTRFTSGRDVSASTMRETFLELWHDQDGGRYGSPGLTGAFLGSWFGGGFIRIGNGGDEITLGGDIVGTGTIGGSTFGNGWLRISSDGSTGLTIDPNEFYFNGLAGNIGTMSAHDLSINRNSTTMIVVGATAITFHDAVVPNANDTHDLGSASARWQQVYAMDFYASATDTALLPSYTWDTDNNTGMFHDAENSIGWSTGGAERMQLGTTNLSFGANATGIPSIKHNAVGSQTAPSYTFNGDSDTGMYRPGADTLSFTAGGLKKLEIDDVASTMGLWVKDYPDDVGNVNVLRANLDNTPGMARVGWYSSWKNHPVTGDVQKDDEIPLVLSPRFPGLSLVDQIIPMDFRRPALKEEYETFEDWREWGFVIDQWVEDAGDGARYLTSHGPGYGMATDENALIALLVAAVQDLRKRVAALEAG